jgi:hypothetical protein
MRRSAAATVVSVILFLALGIVAVDAAEPAAQPPSGGGTVWDTPPRPAPYIAPSPAVGAVRGGARRASPAAATSSGPAAPNRPAGSLGIKAAHVLVPPRAISRAPTNPSTAPVAPTTSPAPPTLPKPVPVHGAYVPPASLVRVGVVSALPRTVPAGQRIRQVLPATLPRPSQVETLAERALVESLDSATAGSGRTPAVSSPEAAEGPVPPVTIPEPASSVPVTSTSGSIAGPGGHGPTPFVAYLEMLLFLATSLFCVRQRAPGARCPRSLTYAPPVPPG